MKIFYLYKTTCLVTGKYYIGRHETEDANDDYIGSGRQLQRSIQKHGRSQHVCEIIKHVANHQALVELEAAVVNEQLLLDPLCMNLTLGGGGDWKYINTIGVVKFKGKTHTDETKAKIGAHHVSNTYNVGKVLSGEHKAKIGAQSSKYLVGKPKSEEHRKKISETLKLAWQRRNMQ